MDRLDFDIQLANMPQSFREMYDAQIFNDNLVCYLPEFILIPISKIREFGALDDKFYHITTRNVGIQFNKVEPHTITTVFSI
jgi:hypothetical protein